MLTCYSPVRHSVFTGVATGWTSFDLHVLSTPPAFVLSQDQTLHQDPHHSFGYPAVRAARPLNRKQSFQPWRKSESRLGSMQMHYCKCVIAFADWHSTDCCCPYSANYFRFDPKALARPRIARTGFWHSLFRFQGTTGTHPEALVPIPGGTDNPCTWDQSSYGFPVALSKGLPEWPM